MGVVMVVRGSGCSNGSNGSGCSNGRWVLGVVMVVRVVGVVMVARGSGCSNGSEG